jgi:hypothetical protein
MRWSAHIMRWSELIMRWSDRIMRWSEHIIRWSEHIMRWSEHIILINETTNTHEIWQENFKRNDIVRPRHMRKDNIIRDS